MSIFTGSSHHKGVSCLIGSVHLTLGLLRHPRDIFPGPQPPAGAGEHRIDGDSWKSPYALGLPFRPGCTMLHSSHGQQVAPAPHSPETPGYLFDGRSQEQGQKTTDFLTPPHSYTPQQSL